MFVRLGLYGEDLDPRLFTAPLERVRGARAIVDPMLASGQWGFERAVRFLRGAAGFTTGSGRAAVSGIGAGPRYVIAYTAGRAQLEDLLGQYLRKAAERASLRRLSRPAAVVWTTFRFRSLRPSCWPTSTSRASRCGRRPTY